MSPRHRGLHTTISHPCGDVTCPGSNPLSTARSRSDQRTHVQTAGGVRTERTDGCTPAVRSRGGRCCDGAGTTLKGAGSGRYYTEHLPSYHLDGGEPPERWWGTGAAQLGLDGAIDNEAFDAVMAGQDSETGKDLGRRFGDSSVRGFDATFSAPKPLHVVTEDQAIGARLSAGMWAAPNSPQGPTDSIPER